MEQEEPLDLSSLQRRVEAGWSPTFLFFWGHSARPGGTIGKECLSQWYPAPFVLDGYRYATAEHYMMAQKAVLFGDDHAARQIRDSQEPAEAKELGRHVRGFDDDRWVEHRFGIVAAGSHAKFSQHPSLRAFLIATSPKVLVEASPRDRIWGIGLAEKNPGVRSPREWRGLNLLGFALMHARSRLAASDRLSPDRP
jgi:ribA/ribD-fused uncharacterized protein